MADHGAGYLKLSILNFLAYENRINNRSAPLLFAGFIALQLAALLGFVRHFFRPTWDQHVSSGIAAIALTCIVCNLLLCFGEYFFHRYLLHIETVAFLRALCTSHLAHHKLTSIGFDDAAHTVRSAYAISDAEHDDQATFPSWALIPFRLLHAVFRAHSLLLPAVADSHRRLHRIADRALPVKSSMSCTTSRTRPGGSGN